MKDAIGLNFAAALRSFLRQDPNIILVGEIRDFETAEIAIKAALTGHLVLSTLHTNDAPIDDVPPHEHGDRAVPRRHLGELHRGAAPRAAHLRGCKEETETPIQTLLSVGFSESRGARRQALQGPRLRQVQQHRVQGTHRADRGDEHERGHPRADSLRRDRHRAPPQGARGRYDHPARVRARRRSGKASRRSTRWFGKPSCRGDEYASHLARAAQDHGRHGRRPTFTSPPTRRR